PAGLSCPSSFSSLLHAPDQQNGHRTVYYVANKKSSTICRLPRNYKPARSFRCRRARRQGTERMDDISAGPYCKEDLIRMAGRRRNVPYWMAPMAPQIRLAIWAIGYNMQALRASNRAQEPELPGRYLKGSR